MAGQITHTEAEVERHIANAVAGHKMAGFEVTDADRDMLRKIATGEVTADQIVAEIVAENAAK